MLFRSPLALLALLTPVPEGLRGNLQAQGQLRLGRRSDQLEVTLALSDAALKDTALTLQRGRVVLQNQMLVLDLALHGSGANNSLEMAGRVPLDPSSPSWSCGWLVAMTACASSPTWRNQP